MRSPQPLPTGAEVELTRLLDEVETKTDYRRVLCLWLRAALGLSAAEVARTLGWRTSSVYNLHSRYLHERATALLRAGRGGTASCSPQQRAREALVGLLCLDGLAGRHGRDESGSPR